MTTAVRRGRGKARRSLELIEAGIEIPRGDPALDSMAKNETNKVGRQLTDARERGWLPWGWIVDEARAVEVVL